MNPERQAEIISAEQAEFAAPAAELTVKGEGGFNTGRLYTARGQRIFWRQYSNGWVTFRDLDRMVGGHIELDTLASNRTVLRSYDIGNFLNWSPDRERIPEWSSMPIPDGFDFGPMLRI